MLVKTPPGQICPKEGKHRDYITDDPKGISMPDTEFYRRLLGEGSLVEVTPAKKAAKANE